MRSDQELGLPAGAELINPHLTTRWTEVAEMQRERAVRLSKFLSLVLRHEPAAAGVALDPEGWVGIDDLLAGMARRGLPINRTELDEVVRTSDKHRFAISPDHRRIRANQGHSVSVDLGLQPIAPPDALYHGTVERSVSSIMKTGIEKGARQYVHLSEDVQTATRVGARRGRPIILTIAAGEMYAAGFRFLRSENGVWLTEHVPPQYISRPAP
jgi:putative RNA 2'-phosphotransferase